MPRQPDKVEIVTDSGTFDKIESCQIVNDITAPTEASFRLGDDQAYAEIDDLVFPAQTFEVRLNGKPRLKGRAETNTYQGSDGVELELVVRTQLSDARYSSADPRVSVKKTSVEDFVLQCYKPLGLTKDDFTFGAFKAADLMTGKASNGDFVDLEPIKEDQAKVNPPETIFAAVERHLKRYGATQWDGPDGKIIIGRPDDEQAPIARLICTRQNRGQGNNILAFRFIRDFSELAREIAVYGNSPGKDIFKSSIKGSAIDEDVDAITFGGDLPHFNRLAIMIDQQAKTQAQADRNAQRELSARRRRKDAFEIQVDGWTYWNGSESIPWANNTTVDVDIEMLGGNQGRYLIVRTDLEYSTDNGLTTSLTMVAPGIWVI